MDQLSQITAALNFDPVTAGIVAMAVALAGVLVVRKGAKMLLRFLGG